jgi:serine/threonine protein kinase
MVAQRYRLVHLLGEGGMGRVWQATDEVSRTNVALKILKELPAHSQHRKRLLREAKAVMSLDHPNVVKVFDALESDDGSPMLVMELLVGESLGERLKRDKELSVSTTAGIMAPVVSAVGTAHARGIVHRDLKPENIFLLRSESEPPDVKVLDFGIAKLMGPSLEATPSTLTVSGHVIGTPRYMAPEQAFGDDVVDHRADIWSLGLILYQCLTGILPTNARSVGQVFKILLTRRIWPLRDVNPQVPADLASMVDRMLAHAVKDRPSDLREVLAVLQSHAKVAAPAFEPAAVGARDELDERDEGVPSRAPASWRPRRRPIARSRIIGLALGSAALAITVAASMKWHPREAAPERAAESKTAPLRASVVTVSTASTVTSIDVMLPAAPQPVAIVEVPPIVEKRAAPRRPPEASRRPVPAPSATPPAAMSAARAPSGLAVELDNPYEHK